MNIWGWGEIAMVAIVLVIAWTFVILWMALEAVSALETKVRDDIADTWLEATKREEKVDALYEHLGLQYVRGYQVASVCKRGEEPQ